MIYSPLDSDQLITNYLESGHAIFMKAPPEVCDAMNGIAGIVLTSLPPNFNNDNDEQNVSETVTAENSQKEITSRTSNNDFQRSHSSSKSRLDKGGDDNATDGNINNNNSSIEKSSSSYEHNNSLQSNKSNKNNTATVITASIPALIEQLEALKKTNSSLNDTNTELQRRCSELIFKESEIRSHSAIKKVTGGGRWRFWCFYLVLCNKLMYT
jgi:hypothetical protein